MGTGAPGELDIIDEAIALYRANVLMSSMEIVSDADHLLIYLTLTISGTLHFGFYVITLCHCRFSYLTCINLHNAVLISF